MSRTESSLDAAAAVLIAAAAVGGTLVTGAMSAVDRPVDALGMSLAGAAGLVLAVRRRRPVAVLAAVTAVLTTYLSLTYPYGPVMFTFVAAVYTVARHRPLQASAWACGAGYVVLLVHVFFHPASLPGLLGLVPATAFAVVPFAIGTTLRINAESVALKRAETVRRHVDEERLRVAQEVHDVVGHGLAAIKMQSEVALHLLEKKPEQAETALTTISETSTAALDELRSTLAMIRQQDASAPRSPSPGLDRLDELRRRIEDAGVTVELDTSGTAIALPSAADAVAYRVLQEALTNVLRHSASKVATVSLRYESKAVSLTITNPDSQSRGEQPGSGLGISGMRERVHGLGGDFTAGHATNGHFEVRATIPTGERS